MVGIQELILTSKRRVGENSVRINYRTCLKRHDAFFYFMILLRWLLAFSGFDLPTRFPVAFFLALALALYAKGFFLLATIGMRRLESPYQCYTNSPCNVADEAPVMRTLTVCPG